MKQGWEIKKLGEVCEKASSNISQNQLVEEIGEFSIYGAGGFIKKISFYHRDKDYISIVKDGAGIGRISLLEAYSSVIGTLQYLMPKKGIDLKYLYYFLSSVDFLRYKNGSTIPHIYFKEYSEEPILIPPIPEQQRIVAILDEASDSIARAKANAEQNLKNARELFESYLQFTFEKTGEGWETCSISQLCEIKHGYAFEGEYFSPNGEYVLLTPGNFYESGGFRVRGEKQKYFIGQIPADYILNEGDLLVAMTEQAAGLLGSPIIVPSSNRYLHNQRLGLVIPKPGIQWDNNFFYHLFNTPKVRKTLHETGTGIKVRHTSPTKIGQVMIAYPNSLIEQRAIVKRLDTLSNQTKKLEAIYQQKIADLEELKKSLLQKAFNGELVSEHDFVD
ncbi:MAG TPA: hypothetical protein DCO83_07150 [Mucilaginibacter sp.]|jgi:type I restriction enzyme S subunit|nr:hypothetical protein [Mucilaginibacter sp.]